MRRFLIGAILCLLSAGAWAALTFPPLTGRVVDDAHLLSPQAQADLSAFLASHEAQTTDQIVVATIPDLQGQEIEEYGVALGRAWGIGQKGKDNGAILIVAPNERKVRIEVGYGLEGTLTDATSNAIIQNVILPDFKDGNMERGVVDGAHAMVSVLGGGDVPMMQAPPPVKLSPLSMLLAVIGIIAFAWMCVRHPILASLLLNTVASYGGSGRSSGGGFSGGGGGFGGGGASGSW